MRFSIVINNFNYARFVGQAIESALDQTYPDVEVVVVDDGSTDNSREVISCYHERGVKSIFKSNAGQGSAFNAGFAASSGDLVLFLDSDDYLQPDAVGKVVAKWKPGISIVYFRLQVVQSDGKKTYFIPDISRPIPEGVIWPDIVEQGREPESVPPTSGDVFSRAVLAECLPMPEAIHRIDADGYIRAFASFRGEVAAIQEALGYYRQHRANNTRGMFFSLPKIRERLSRDTVTFALLHQGAALHGRQLKSVPERNYFDHLRLRLISLCEDRCGHPFPGDRRLQLYWWSLGALFGHARPFWKKILQGIQITLLATLPAPIMGGLNRLWSRLKARLP